MTEKELSELWQKVQRVGEINKLDDDAMTALGSVFGELKAEVRRLSSLEEKNKQLKSKLYEVTG